ncbi:MAG: tyrosine-type recombinase/integrase [Bacteroidetes bacterium]|nr:tyrosine-type recombinase/integrase [Bacteroidota bacterium]
MLLPIKLICNASKARRNGTSLIFIQYCMNAENKTLLNTEIAIPANYWHKKYMRVLESMPIKFGIAEQINKELQRQVRLAEDIISFALYKKISNPVKFVKNTFSPNFEHGQLEKTYAKAASKNPKINLDFFFQMDDYIRSKEGTVADGTMDVFKNLKKIMHSFETFRNKKICFNQINFSFYEELVQYLTFEHTHYRRKEVKKGFKANTIGKTIKQLIIFLKNRKLKRIINELDLSGFKIFEEEADAIYLTTSEIKSIYNLDLSQQDYLKKYRDLFIFGCLTGLRFSDFSVISSDDVRDGMLYKKQGKTKHWVVIHLRKEAIHIYTYGFNKIFPEVSNPEFNKYIKEVGKLAGLTQPIKHSYKKGNREIVETKAKFEWITSHTCRRSFCTNEFMAETPVELIMKISGHKSLKDFYRYIKIAPEQAGQRMKELWQNRGELV